jgi:hypothetical protein
MPAIIAVVVLCFVFAIAWIGASRLFFGKEAAFVGPMDAPTEKPEYCGEAKDDGWVRQVTAPSGESDHWSEPIPAVLDGRLPYLGANYALRVRVVDDLNEDEAPQADEVTDEFVVRDSGDFPKGRGFARWFLLQMEGGLPEKVTVLYLTSDERARCDAATGPEKTRLLHDLAQELSRGPEAELAVFEPEVQQDDRPIEQDVSHLLGTSRFGVTLVTDVRSLAVPAESSGRWSSLVPLCRRTLMDGQKCDYWAVPVVGDAPLRARLVFDGNDDNVASDYELTPESKKQFLLRPGNSATWCQPAWQLAGRRADSGDGYYKLQVQTDSAASGHISICYVHPVVLEKLRQGYTLEEALDRVLEWELE